MQGVWKIHTQKLGKLGAVVSSRRCCISQALTMKLFQQCEGCFPFSSAATSIYSLKAADSRKPFAVEKLEESTVATNWALSNHDMPSPETNSNYDGICSVLQLISIDLPCVCQSWRSEPGSGTNSTWYMFGQETAFQPQRSNGLPWRWPYSNSSKAKDQHVALATAAIVAFRGAGSSSNLNFFNWYLSSVPRYGAVKASPTLTAHLMPTRILCVQGIIFLNDFIGSEMWQLILS